MMKYIKSLLVFTTILSTSINCTAQKYFTKTGDILFFSSTPIEDIEANSHTATTVLDMESGKIQWAVLIKSFEFEKALMQEHFNENYMESSKFPKATFKGEISDIENLDLTKDGMYAVHVSGELTIHGETNSVDTKAMFSVEGGKIQASSKLKVLVADYGIEIPSVVKENIAKEIKIDINANYDILERS